MKERIEVEYIHKDLIYKNYWNPNEQTKETYTNLLESIKDEGCDEPILVVEKEKDVEYLIIGGEHRYTGSVENGFEYIPCIVKRGDKWLDENFQKMETVKRNNLRGRLNDYKFTEIVRDVVEDTGLTYSEISYKTGFDSESKLMKHIIEDKEELEREVRKYAVESQEREDSGSVKHYDNVFDVVNTIFTEYGGQLQSGYIWFFHGGQMNLYLPINDSVNSEIVKLVDYIDKRGDNYSMCDFLQNAINNELMRLQHEGKPDN